MQTNDPKEVRSIDRLARDRKKRYDAAFRKVLETPEGRFLFGDREHGLLAVCGTFKSIWARDASIHYNAGQQDLGHRMMADIAAIDEQLYLLMEGECRAIAVRDQRERQAAEDVAKKERKSDD